MEEQLQEMKEHEVKLLNKTMEFDKKLVEIDIKLQHQDENLARVEKSIIEEIHTTVTERMQSMQNIVLEQQKTQREMIRIQGKQGEQIDGIQKTLEQFTKIEEQVNQHEVRLKTLELNQHNEAELKKERIKGRIAIITASISAVLGLVGTIIAIVLK